VISRNTKGAGPPTLLIATVSLLCTFLLSVAPSLSEFKSGALVLAVPHLVVVATVLWAEWRVAGTVLTAFGVFSIAYTVVVSVPFLSSSSDAGHLTLASNIVAKAGFVYSCFYLAALIAYFGTRSARRKRDMTAVWAQSIGAVSHLALFAFLAASAHVVLVLYSSDLSIATIWRDPRAMIFAGSEAGASWLTIAQSTCFDLFCAAYAVAWMAGLRVGRRLFFGACIVALALLGGYKFGFVIPLICVLVYAGHVRVTNSMFIRGGVVLLSLVTVAFWWRDGVEPVNIAEEIVKYNHAFYYAGRAISEYEPTAELLNKAVGDFLITPVPRVIWPGKPREYGLARGVLDYELLPRGAAIEGRAYTTMGLAETWLALGIVGVLLHGAIIGLLMALAWDWIGSRELYKVLTGLLMAKHGYLFLRTGLFDTYWYFVLAVFVAARLLSLGSVSRPIALRSSRERGTLRSLGMVS